LKNVKTCVEYFNIFQLFIDIYNTYFYFLEISPPNTDRAGG